MNAHQLHQRTNDKPRTRQRGRSPRTATNTQVNGHVSADRSQDMVLSAKNQNAAVSSRLLHLAAQLATADLTVLHALEALRLATSDQLRRLLFATGPDHTRALRARRSLQRLHTLRLVGRLDRHVGGRGAGSSGFTYHLTSDAQRLLRVRPAEPQRLPGAREHTLAVTELAVTLHEADRAGALELVRFDAEPASWRRWTDNDGHRHQVRPDAFLIVAAGAWERLWFVELDRGTQSPAVIRRKAHAYAAYAQTGREQEEHGVFPRVVYLTTDGPDRCRALARALADTPHADQLATVAELDDATHTLTTPDREQAT